MNDLSKVIERKSKQILFADDTCITFTSSTLESFKHDIRSEFESLNKLFKVNKTLDKTHFIQFTTENSPQIDLDISFANKLNSKAYDTKFLGIHVDSTVLENSY
jgi:hypothetical protein